MYSLSIIFFMHLIHISLIEMPFLIAGLIDSDGCLTWHWNADRTLVVSVTITQKLDTQILFDVKRAIGGNVTTTNGNWKQHTLKGVKQECLPVLFDDLQDINSCRLLTGKRLDAILIFYVMIEMVDTKHHTSEEGRKILVDLRKYLHAGSSSASALTPAQLESRLKLPLNSSQSAGKTVAENCKQISDTSFQPIVNNVKQGIYINGWQVCGFFLGDGGAHLVWGTHLITVTLGFTGDKSSKVGLELYAASLVRDGVYRQAWTSLIPTSNVSRLILNGVDLFSTNVKLFFEEYPLPTHYHKVIRLNKFLTTATFLTTLKEKQKQNQPWTSQDWTTLEQCIVDTWDLNPSGKARKFKDPVVYLAHLKKAYANRKLKIR